LHLVQAPIVQLVTEFFDSSLPLFPSNAGGVIDGGIHNLARCEAIIDFAGRCHYVYRYVLVTSLVRGVSAL